MFYFPLQKILSFKIDISYEKCLLRQTCTALWTFSSIPNGLLSDDRRQCEIKGHHCFASPRRMPSPHRCSIDGCKDGPTQGIECRHLKADPSLQTCPSLLILDSWRLLISPSPCKSVSAHVHRRDRATKEVQGCFNSQWCVCQCSNWSTWNGDCMFRLYFTKCSDPPT